MSQTTVRIPTPLRPLAGGADHVVLDAATVREALDVLGRQHAELRDRVLDESGAPRTFVNLFVGSKDVRQLDGLDTPLAEGDVLSILPAVAGGAR